MTPCIQVVKYIAILELRQMQSRKNQHILVLGAGNFGTCLGQHLASQGHQVDLWARSAVIAEGINQSHRNPKYLKNIPLSPSLTAFSRLQDASAKAYDVIVIAVPTQYIRTVIEQIRDIIQVEQLLVCAAKGIEIGTEKLPSDIIAELCGTMIAHHMVSLSGPSFAIEVAKQQPTGVSVASRVISRAEWAQAVFHAPKFRAYTGNDPVGLEIAGALKNVIAIAAGACAGLGFQANSRATLITRGLAEMTRLGVAMGANPLTFKGLGGVGDLFLTCSSEKSRNFSVGYILGQGGSLDEALAQIGSVAEGVTTTLSAHKLAKTLKVSVPITNAVYKVLYEKKPISEVVVELISRDAKPEIELVKEVPPN